MILHSGVDRLSTTGSEQNWQSTKTVKQDISDFGLCDAWRFHHPNFRDYTLFTPVHHSYSRLGNFLVSSSLMRDISETKIYPITISNHAPVSITLMNERLTTPTRNWRFNTYLLKDPDFNNHFKREWATHLENNDLPGISSCVLWEEIKAVIQGKIISFLSCNKKSSRKKGATYLA